MTAPTATIPTTDGKTLFIGLAVPAGTDSVPDQLPQGELSGRPNVWAECLLCAPSTAYRILVNDDHGPTPSLRYSLYPVTIQEAMAMTEHDDDLIDACAQLADSGSAAVLNGETFRYQLTSALTEGPAPETPTMDELKERTSFIRGSMLVRPFDQEID